MRAVDALRQFGQAKQVPEKTLFGLTLALEECGSNIVNHALRRDAQQQFQVAIEHFDTRITIELRDRGPEFDPTRLHVVRPSGDEPGGWGIQLIRRYMDEISYAREGGENVLRLTKRLGQETSQNSFATSKPNTETPEHQTPESI